MDQQRGSSPERLSNELHRHFVGVGESEAKAVTCPAKVGDDESLEWRIIFHAKWAVVLVGGGKRGQCDLAKGKRADQSRDSGVMPAHW